MKGFMFFFAVVLTVICFAIAAYAGDWQVLSAEVKSAVIYNAKANQVQAGVAMEMAAYKDALEFDLLVGPPKQTLAIGCAYEAPVVEQLLNSMGLELPAVLQGRVTQSIGLHAGIDGLGSPDIDTNIGAYVTALRYTF